MVSAPDSQSDLILAERIKVYFSESTVQVIAGAIVVTAVSALTHQYSPFWSLAVALVSIYAITLIRLQQAWVFSKMPELKHNADWGKVQTWCAGFAGIAWALAFLPMLPNMPIEYQFLVIAVCAVSVATATAEGFSYVWPSFAFSMTLTIPLIVWLVTRDSNVHVILGLLLMIFLPMVLWQGRKRGSAYVQAIQMRLQNERLARELSLQCELAENASREKTRFLAAASHDLRQPIAAALLFVDALKHTSPTPGQSKIISKLDQAISVFSNQMGRLLDISKFDAGLIKPEFKPCNLSVLFAWLEQTFAKVAYGKGLRFILHLPKDHSLSIHTDLAMLESVLMNLVSNAIKFTNRGGILIGARVRHGKVLLQVWDTGMGIEEMHLSKIFDEFYQVENPQRNREAGLGLGLSIAKRAVALLGSNIVCRSRPRRGSVFELSLPVAQVEQGAYQKVAPNRQAIESGMGKLQGKNILVLEDDELVREAMVALLRGAGATVQAYSNGEAALNNPQTGGADFFIVDYSLGQNIHGLAFLEAVEKNFKREVQAVIVTGETSPEFMGLMSSRRWPILHKPVNLADLLSVM